MFSKKLTVEYYRREGQNVQESHKYQQNIIAFILFLNFLLIFFFYFTDRPRFSLSPLLQCLSPPFL